MGESRAERNKKPSVGAGVLHGRISLCGKFVLPVLVLLLVAFTLAVGGRPALAQKAGGAGAARMAQASSPGKPDGPAAAPAAEAPQAMEGAKEANQRLDAWHKEFDLIDQELKRGRAHDDVYNKIRDKLEAVRRDLDGFVGEMTPRIQAAQEQLDKLGKAPEENAEPEAPAAATERKNLNALIGALKGYNGAAEVLRVRGGQLLNTLQERRRQLFTGGLMERAPLLTKRFWRDVGAAAPGFDERIGRILGNWWSGADAQFDFLLIGVLCLISWGVISVISRKMVVHFRAWHDGQPDAPPLWRRASSAAWVIILRATPTAAAAALFYFCTTEFELVTPEVEPLAYALALAVCSVAVVGALAKTLLAPHEPHWRIFPASDLAASRIYAMSIALSCVYGADLVLEAVLNAGVAAESLYVVKSLVTDLVFGGLMVGILVMAKNGVTHHDGLESVVAKSPWILLLRIPLWTAAVAILAATFSGHVAFGRFLAAQVMVTAVILVIVYLLLIWTDALNHAIVDEDMPLGRKFNAARLDQRRRKQIALPIKLGLQALIILVAGPLVLLQWGFDQKDVRDWFARAFYGFEIGNIIISPAAIVGAAVVFAVGYLAAQFFRNWIDKQVLVPAGVTGGARDSITTGVGYLGVSVAAILAFSYIGVNSSHIALVAGALSLGIGFGLQSIVNNFVSGLILLAERPIKVGDWIVVHGEEGFVRRISVRTTEVETFDHHNVIVPNSVLISERLRNCTLHNNTGRVMITVGVSYDADPELVRDILLNVAQDNPHILNWPQPFVYFSDFAASSMEFKLFVYLVDIKQHHTVRTELRIAIWKAFRDAGVQIPYNQHDVHLRDLDWIKGAIVRQIANAREENAREEASIGAGDGKPANDGHALGQSNSRR